MLVYTIARPAEIGPMRGGRADVADAGDPTEQLVRLADLRDKGVLTEEEFQEQKRRVLS